MPPVEAAEGVVHQGGVHLQGVVVVEEAGHQSVGHCQRVEVGVVEGLDS